MAGARSDDRLQQYFDGELAADDADALRRELEADDELRAKLEGLAHLRTLLVAAAEERADEIDSEALFGRILDKLEAPTAGAAETSPSAALESAALESEARPALKVVDGGKSRATSTERPAGSNVVWIGVAATLAVAAAVLIAVLKPFGLGGSSSGTGTDGLAAAPPPGSEVVEVDFGYSTGAIFSVEGQSGEHYAVIWISDEKPSVEAPLPGTDSTEERIQ